MGALILVLFACAWPSSAPSPSQPYTVETVVYDLPQSATAHAIGADSPPEAGHPRPEAVDAQAKAPPEAGGAVTRTNPGVGGDHAD